VPKAVEVVHAPRQIRRAPALTGRQPSDQADPAHHGHRAAAKRHHRAHLLLRQEGWWDSLHDGDASTETRPVQRRLRPHARRSATTEDSPTSGPGRAIGDVSGTAGEWSDRTWSHLTRRPDNSPAPPAANAVRPRTASTLVRHHRPCSRRCDAARQGRIVVARWAATRRNFPSWPARSTLGCGGHDRRGRA
jgi:hypothetical protein